MPSITVGSSCADFTLTPKVSTGFSFFGIKNGTSAPVKFLSIDSTGTPRVIDFTSTTTFSNGTINATPPYNVDLDDFNIKLKWKSGVSFNGADTGSTLNRYTISNSYGDSTSYAAILPIVQLVTPEQVDVTSSYNTSSIFKYGSGSSPDEYVMQNSLPSLTATVSFYLLDSGYPLKTGEKYVLYSDGNRYDLNNGLPDMTKVVQYSFAEQLTTDGVVFTFATSAQIPTGASSTITNKTVTDKDNNTYRLVTVKPTPDPDTYDASRLESATFPVWTNSVDPPITVDLETNGELRAGHPKTGTDRSNFITIDDSFLASANRSLFSLTNVNDKSVIITEFYFAASRVGNLKVAWSKSVPNSPNMGFYKHIPAIIVNLLGTDTGNGGLAQLVTNTSIMNQYNLGPFTDRNVISVTSKVYNKADPNTYTKVTLPGSGFVLAQNEFLNFFIFDTDPGQASIIRTAYTWNQNSKKLWTFDGETSVGTDNSYIDIFPGFQNFTASTNSTDLTVSLRNMQPYKPAEYDSKGEKIPGTDTFGNFLMPYIRFKFNPGTIPYTSPGSMRYLATTSSSFTALQLKPILDLGSDANWAIFNIYRASIETSSQSFLLMSSSGSPYTVFYINTSGTFSKMSLATSSSPMDYTQYNGTWKLETGPDTDGKYLVFYNTAGTGGAITKWTLQTDLTFKTAGTSPLELKCSKCSSVGICFG